MESNLKILAFDTSWDTFVVSSMIGLGVVQKTIGIAPRAASEGLLPWIMDVLVKSNWTPSKIDLIAVGAGPGSYTGTRISVTIAKAIAEITHCRLASISSLEAEALSVGMPGEKVVIIKNAGRGEVLLAAYLLKELPRDISRVSAVNFTELVKIKEPQVLKPAVAAKLLKEELDSGVTVITYNFSVPLLSNEIDDISRKNIKVIKEPFINPVAMASIALQKYFEGRCDDPALLEPFYIRTY